MLEQKIRPLIQKYFINKLAKILNYTKVKANTITLLSLMTGQ